MPVKVYELAKEFGVKNTEMVKTLTQMGMERLSPSSDLNEADEARARAAFANRADSDSGDGAAPATTTAPAASSARKRSTVARPVQTVPVQTACPQCALPCPHPAQLPPRHKRRPRPPQVAANRLKFRP